MARLSASSARRAFLPSFSRGMNLGTGDTSFPRTEYENPRPLLTEDCGGAYWTRTSDPIDVNDVLYQLSQSTKDLCEPILAFCPPRHIRDTLRIGSSVMYISQYVLPTEPKHQGLPPDALHWKQNLLYSHTGKLSRAAAGKFSVIAMTAAKARGWARMFSSRAFAGGFSARGSSCRRSSRKRRRRVYRCPAGRGWPG